MVQEYLTCMSRRAAQQSRKELHAAAKQAKRSMHRARLCVEAAACARTSAASQAMRKRMGGSQRSEAVTARSTFSATWLGLTSPQAYAAAKSAMAQRRRRCFCSAGSGAAWKPACA
jgi:hypothetical protein